MPIDSPDLATPIKIKRRGILYSRLFQSQTLALPPPRISNALAHVVRFISNHFSHLKEILHFVQNDKRRVLGCEQGDINARSGRFRCRIFSYLLICEI